MPSTSRARVYASSRRIYIIFGLVKIVHHRTGGTYGTTYPEFPYINVLFYYIIRSSSFVR